jgi:hypothetical protein
MKGVDLRTVQEVMGHKTLAMTLRYAHLSPGHQMDAVRRLDENPTGTPAGTEPSDDQPTSDGDGELLDFAVEMSGGAQNRTADLGIMRPSL